MQNGASSPEARSLHARVIADDDETYEVPPVNSLLAGTVDSIRASEMPLDAFEQAWASEGSAAWRISSRIVVACEDVGTIAIRRPSASVLAPGRFRRLNSPERRIEPAGLDKFVVGVDLGHAATSRTWIRSACRTVAREPVGDHERRPPLGDRLGRDRWIAGPGLSRYPTELVASSSPEDGETADGASCRSAPGGYRLPRRRRVYADQRRARRSSGGPKEHVATLRKYRLLGDGSA